MKLKSLKIPAYIIAIGLVLSLVACLLTGMIKEPVITEHDFNYTVTYTLNGETQTLEGVYRCRFVSTGEGTEPLERYYEGFFISNPSEAHPAAHTIAEMDGLELCVASTFSNKYLMGDTKGVPEATFLYDPYLVVIDQEGYEYDISEFPGKFDAELVSWEQPEPVVNSFDFVGFSHLHDGSMLAMLIVGILVILACMIFVKRDKTVPYKVLDKVSIVLNYIIVLAGIPFAALVVWLMQIYVGGEELVYQVDLCVPAITAFTIAASLSLRRKGFTKSGFFIQFVGPVLFALLIALESVL